ncbi:hypothetical protein FSP39_013094 [Pinctada imbricata]|uniref:Tripartite motif-containing protein 2 n=1 Tax=Pinctada imbricata TaxID=66713 RepID=A0AA88YBI5_PINIB|nr:hypothetical protein FSP39_013094 [Pinctada imbricata]
MLDNDRIFTGFGPMIIRRITPSGTQSEVCSTAPLHPAGVSISFNGDLLVTLCSCNVSKISSDSYGEVHQIEKSGVVQRRYTHTEDHRSKLFVNPLKVAQNVNKDLCVVDIIDNEFRSRLVVLSESSKLRFIYKGQQSFSKKFTSNDVACDDRGRILVTDYYNHAVHVLLEDGHFLQYLLTEQSPLSYPRSLGLHGDTLWVGCDKGVVRVYKYGEQ